MKLMHLQRNLMIAVLASVVVVTMVACGDDSGDAPDARIVLMPDAPVGVMPDAPVGGPPDAAAGDMNDGFGQSFPLTIGDTVGDTEVIQMPGDHDYFTFDGTAGQWVRVLIEANADDNPMNVDTVVTMFNSTTQQIAENDDAVPRLNTDSEIIIRLPATGAYYLEVQEYSDWDNDTTTPAEGNNGFIYKIYVVEVNPATVGVVLDPETGDAAANATALEFSTMSGEALAVGDFNDATDVDVYSFTMSAAPAQMLTAAVMPNGTDGYGATVPVGRLWITNQAGTTTIAAITPSAPVLLQHVAPPLPAGNYLLWISHPAGAPSGTNPFNVVKAAPSMDNPAEAESTATPGANNTTAGAEAITFTASGTARLGFVTAHLSGAGDIDYFRVVTMGAETISIACGSARVGSGVQGLNVSIRNSSDGVVTAANEALGANLFLDSIAVPAAGTYYMRLAKTGQDAVVTGDWVRCGIYLQP